MVSQLSQVLHDLGRVLSEGVERELGNVLDETRALEAHRALKGLLVRQDPDVGDALGEALDRRHVVADVAVVQHGADGVADALELAKVHEAVLGEGLVAVLEERQVREVDANVRHARRLELLQLESVVLVVGLDQHAQLLLDHKELEPHLLPRRAQAHDRRVVEAGHDLHDAVEVLQPIELQRDGDEALDEPSALRHAFGRENARHDPHGDAVKVVRDVHNVRRPEQLVGLGPALVYELVPPHALQVVELDDRQLLRKVVDAQRIRR